jgi:hypothetical protein
MNRIGLTKNLWLDEYIPKELYLKFEKKPHILIGLLDRRLVIADQLLRDKFGSVTINNWWNGGNRNWSGIRTPDSSYYSQTSQHSWGRGSDKIFTNATAQEVREYIKGMYEELGITCIEENVTWVHSDVRWTRSNELLIVYP